MGDGPSLTFSLLAKVFAKGKMFWYMCRFFVVVVVEAVGGGLRSFHTLYTVKLSQTTNGFFLLGVDIMEQHLKVKSE